MEFSETAADAEDGRCGMEDTTETKSLEYAIQLNDVWKRFKRTEVLKGLSMQVPMGKIYGLLGPSGCGKTTLLKCLVGRLRPDSGLIRVMGQRPGKLGHRVPGRLVGYMPQDLALYQEFTISEILYYFGRIFQMTTDAIEAEINFLASLLNLPDRYKIICQLSGGQKRRVSFACALLHKPPLLILDEPTVGVDPLLRQCIWHHLVSIVSNKERPTSVIITTHYIEEARQGHMVALMRNGKLLAESSPASLLSLYNEATLEAVFLKLCRLNSADLKGGSSIGVSPTASVAAATAASKGVTALPVDTESSAVSANSVKADTAVARDSRDTVGAGDLEYREAVSITESIRGFLEPPNPRRVLSVVCKEVTNLRRRITFLLFQFTLPVLQIVLFCVCIGRDPFGLRLAVANMDKSGTLGVRFIQHLSNSTFYKTFHGDIASARTAVRSGNAWAVVYIRANFSSAMQQRFTNPLAITNGTLAESSVHVQVDNSNYQVSAVLRQSVASSLQTFAGDLLQESGLDRSLASLPLIIEPPLLGSKDPTFTEFMAPGIIVSIIFFMATGLTALSFVLERKEGLLDRGLVAGMSVLELTLGHMITQLIILTGQTALLLVFCLAVFRVPCHGSLPLVIVLALASGFTGMSLGLLISAVCSVETSAIQVALGTMYPSLLLSGIIWPVEAMPVFLRHFSSVLPTTLVVDAMRSVIGRGFGITATSVWLGLVSTSAWSGFLVTLAVVLLKVRGT